MDIPAIDSSQIKTGDLPESSDQRQGSINSLQQAGFATAGLSYQVSELPFTQLQFYIVQYHQPIRLPDISIRNFDNNRHSYNKLPGYKIFTTFYAFLVKWLFFRRRR